MVQKIFAIIFTIMASVVGGVVLTLWTLYNESGEVRTIYLLPGAVYTLLIATYIIAAFVLFFSAKKKE